MTGVPEMPEVVNSDTNVNGIIVSNGDSDNRAIAQIRLSIADTKQPLNNSIEVLNGENECDEEAQAERDSSG